uniref:Uncharacterized protein n=1 Tax=Cannabis sativa TaxID=3483 RepID=A0A803NL32_CANSA
MVVTRRGNQSNTVDPMVTDPNVQTPGNARDPPGTALRQVNTQPPTTGHRVTFPLAGFTLGVQETGNTSTTAEHTTPGTRIPSTSNTQRFTTEATKVKGLTEEGRLATILGEFLDRVDGFIKLKEAVRRVDIVRQKKTQQHTNAANTSIELDQNSQNHNSSNKGGKRSNNGNRQGNGKKGMLGDNSEQHPRENASKFTAFTILIEDIETIYATT